MRPRDIIVTLFFKHNCNWEETFKSIQDREEVLEKEVLSCEQVTDKHYITILDDEYPETLKQVFKPPFVIYYEGDLKVITDNNFVFVDDKCKLDIPEEILVTTKDNIVNFKNLKITSLDNRAEIIAIALSKATIKASKDFKPYILCVLEMGKDLFVEPTSKHNNSLIKEGAMLIDCVKDLSDYGNIILK